MPLNSQEKIDNYLTRVEKLLPTITSDSPTSTKFKRAVLTRVNTLSRSITIPEEAHEDQEEENRPPAAAAAAIVDTKLSKKEKANILVTRRVEAIRNSLEEPYLEPSDFAELLKTGKTGETHAENEDAALRRLCRGYTDDGIRDIAIWKTVLGTYFIPRKDYKSLQEQAQGQRLKPLGTRIGSRHRVIEREDTSDGGHFYIRFLMSCMERLLFAKDWREIGKEPGSKAWKTTFYRAYFQQFSEFRGKFQGLDADAKQEKMIEMNADYQLWVRRNETEVCARTRFLEMYEKLGVGVLLDPTWDVQHIYTRCSANFGHVLTNLYNTLPKDNVPATADTPASTVSCLIKYNETCKQWILNACWVLSYQDASVHDYINQFFETMAE